MMFFVMHHPFTHSFVCKIGHNLHQMSFCINKSPAEYSGGDPKNSPYSYIEPVWFLSVENSPVSMPGRSFSLA